MENKVTLKIPRPLYEKLKQIIQGSGFSSVNEFVVYVLRDLAASGQESAGINQSHNTERRRQVTEQEQLTREELEAIRKRLKSLGYL